MAVNADVSRATVEHELGRAALSAERRGWKLQWDPQTLTLLVSITASDKDVYVFEFHLDDYPEIPPLIDVVHPESGARNTAVCFPTGGKGYFYQNCRICAYWSRNAYGLLAGPHPDWNIGDWTRKDPARSELGQILGLLDDLLHDPTYKGRTAL